jgi:PIN domain nuclease of toxin-antitoxin system
MILLDTCAIIWDALEPTSLSTGAREAITQADKHDALIMSDISCWEVAMLVRKGRLVISTSSSDLLTLYLQSRSIAVQSISPEIAELSVNFDSGLNKDPADRIIAATSILNNARLVTADRNMLENELLDTIW